MFELWIGVITGALVAYLVNRFEPAQEKIADPNGGTERAASVPNSAAVKVGPAAKQKRKTLSQWFRETRRFFRILPWFWIVTFLIFALLLIAPIGEAWSIVTGRLTWAEKVFEIVRTVALPWIAGFGFGMWLYHIIGLHGRSADTAPMSLVPAGIAILAFTIMFSEDRYGWLSRLEKFSFGGGSIEFSELKSQNGSSSVPVERNTQPSYATRGPVIEGTSRVSDLIAFMIASKRIIERDQSYIESSGVIGKPANLVLASDKDFFGLVIFPLGKRLGLIHNARAYNSEIASFSDFADDFRSFVLNPSTTDEDRGSVKAIATRLEEIWDQSCKVEFSLRAANLIAPLPGEKPRTAVQQPQTPSQQPQIPSQQSQTPSQQPQTPSQPVQPSKEQAKETCADEKNTALSVLGRRSPGEAFNAKFSLNRNLPYGTILSALLLAAAGEVPAAIRDLDIWIGEQAERDEPISDIYLYRARYMRGDIKQNSNPVGVDLLEKITHWQDALRTGFPIANSEKWNRGYSVLKNSGSLPFWKRSSCSRTLDLPFKQFLFSFLGTKTNYLDAISRTGLHNLPRSEIRDLQNLTDELSQLAFECLLENASEEEALRVSALRVSTFDTLARLETMFAERAARAEDKRSHLCQAGRLSRDAFEEFRNQRSTSDLAEGAKPSGQSSEPWRYIALNAEKRNRLDARNMQNYYEGRLSDVEAKISEERITCP